MTAHSHLAIGADPPERPAGLSVSLVSQVRHFGIPDRDGNHHVGGESGGVLGERLLFLNFW